MGKNLSIGTTSEAMFQDSWHFQVPLILEHNLRGVILYFKNCTLLHLLDITLGPSVSCIYILWVV